MALCVYCAQHVGNTRDHVWPSSRKPPRGRFNTVPCCPRCNSEKGDLSCEEWVQAQARELAELDERKDNFIYIGSRAGRAITYTVGDRRSFLRHRLHRLADLRHHEPFVWSWALPPEDEMILDEWASGAYV